MNRPEAISHLVNEATSLDSEEADPMTLLMDAAAFIASEYGMEMEALLEYTKAFIAAKDTFDAAELEALKMVHGLHLN